MSGGFGDSGGFRDEDDLGDLLPRGSLAASFSFDPPSDGGELDANPFADMESTHVYHSHSPTTAIATPSPSFAYPVAPPPEDDAFSSSSSPPYAPPSFNRESAPEPETPSHSFSNNYPDSEPSSPSPRAPSAPVYSPVLPHADQTPFGSPPASPTSPSKVLLPHVRHRSAADMAELLGEEKPILPTFAKRREASAVLGKEDHVLPVSSLGKKAVEGPLARLLGLVDESDEPPPPPPPPPIVEKVAPPPIKEAAKSEEAPEAILEPSTAPPVPESKTEPIVNPPSPSAADATPAVHPFVTSLAAASAIPLPPSPSTTPPPPPTLAVDQPTLSRTSSSAPSLAPSEAEAEYASVVSPMNTGDGERKGPVLNGSLEHVGENGTEVLEEKLEKLQVEEGAQEAREANGTEGSHSMASSQETTTEGGADGKDVDMSPKEQAALPSVFATPTSPFREHPTPLPTSPTSPFAPIFNHDEPLSLPHSSRPSLFDDSGASSPTHTRGFRSYNASADDGNGFMDDTDSTRGTYSRSVDVEHGDEDTVMGTDASEGAESLSPVPLAADVRSTGTVSPPLPSVPFSGTTPTKASDGTLGPSFIISVGDPQKIGSSLNVAAQHTVYTVRTQTTSSAFRKPEFSVLRRFSHFLWLFDALTINNPGVIVPGMPEKSALGRFGSEFVENRRSALQAALMKIVSHPMLVGDPDLRLFLESDTFSVDIKQRRLETPAENTGFFASLTSTISGPTFVEFDEYFDARRETLDTFEIQLKSLLVSLSNAAKHRTALQSSLGELESALLGLSMCDLSGPLRGALEKAANVQKRLRELGEQQSESEEKIGGLTSVAEGYSRLCGSVKLVFGARVKSYHAWKAAESNLRKAKAAHEKAKKSGRAHSELLGLSLAETADAERKMLDAKQDFEDVSKLTKAEMARFDKEKVEDFKKAVAAYADGLVMRQREVVNLWTNYHEALLQVAALNAPPGQPRQIEAGGEE